MNENNPTNFSQLLRSDSQTTEATINQCLKDLRLAGFEIQKTPASINELVSFLNLLFEDCFAKNDRRIKHFIYQVDIGEKLVQEALLGKSTASENPLEVLSISVVMREYKKVYLRKKFANG